MNPACFSFYLHDQSIYPQYNRRGETSFLRLHHYQAVEDSGTVGPISFIPAEALATARKQNSYIILDVQVEALAIPLPPRTPPPPEARRRGNANKTTPKRSTRPDDVGAGLAPCCPLAVSAIGEDGIRGEGGVVKFMASTPRDRQRVDGNSKAGCAGRSDMDGDSTRPRVSTTPVTPVDGNETTTLRREGGSLTTPEGSNTTVDDRTPSTWSSWHSSYAGSAAKRRAEDIMTRIDALEVSFRRIEERGLGRQDWTTATVGGGGVGIYHRQARSMRQQPRNARNSHDVTATMSVSACLGGLGESQGACIRRIHSHDQTFPTNEPGV